MFAIAFLFVRVLCDGFKSRRRLEAEILELRHQLNVLQQRAPRRLYLSWANRACFTSKADTEAMQTDVRFGPKADSCSAAKRDLIRSPRACEQLRWNFKAECLCGFQVDYEFDLGRLFNRKVSGGFAN